MTDSPRTTLADGSPVLPDHREIDPRTGQQRGYVVLSAEERAKGFVRPVRDSYVHVGIRPQHPLRDLTAEEAATHAERGYVKYEEYPPSGHPVVGRFWTARELRSGCGQVTKMSRAIAETYARDPGFYGSTFCWACAKHYPVGAAGEFVWKGTDERVGT